MTWVGSIGGICRDFRQAASPAASMIFLPGCGTEVTGEIEVVDKANEQAVEFADLPSEDELNIIDGDGFSRAVVHSTDWTAETIVNQLKRGNILLKPRFQRRDAWKLQQKSRFIESLILGLPVPQIVLAEQKEQRGKFIVLDGKQRLLSLLQFWNEGEAGPNKGFRLSGLQVRLELNRVGYEQLSTDARYESFYNSLSNQPIRTVVIKNWPDTNFLHLVFLRLNTGSVKLSPQELRQAIVPGPFTDWIDEAAIQSEALKRLLKLDAPDYRMRDVELLARYFAFQNFLHDYRGRMKEFLDLSFSRFNSEWDEREPACIDQLDSFDAAVQSLEALFGDGVARKPEGRQLNKAIFDFLIFYAVRADVRQVFQDRAQELLDAYQTLFEDREFLASIERDTAGLPSTARRISAWGDALNRIGGLDLPLPRLVEVDGDQRIQI